MVVAENLGPFAHPSAVNNVAVRVGQSKNVDPLADRKFCRARFRLAGGRVTGDRRSPCSRRCGQLQIVDFREAFFDFRLFHDRCDIRQRSSINLAGMDAERIAGDADFFFRDFPPVVGELELLLGVGRAFEFLGGEQFQLLVFSARSRDSPVDQSPL